MRTPLDSTTGRHLLAVLAATLVACGGDDDGSNPGSDGGGGSEDATIAAADAFASDCAPQSGTTIALELVTEDVNEPMLVTSPPGDARLFVVENGGTIRIVSDGQVLDAPFLDISSEIVAGGEQGLLGLAFHPDYATNGRFFVYYTAQGGAEANTVAEYHASDRDPDLADPASGTIILAIDDIATNHNGGMIAFGPDGYLYIGTGDGGGSGDPADNGQSVTSVLGKILRIDVDDGAPYGIPADNPLADSVTAGVRKEIWHTGMRNPWRWSFDRGSGDMWIGDVGQGSWEEVDHIAAGEGGKNLGWSDKEGLACFDEDPCATPLTLEPAVSFTDPVAVYPNPPGSGEAGAASVVGGYVYRGGCYPDIQGQYFYADVFSDVIWTIDTAARPLAETEVDYGTPLQYIVSFGEDAAGELYVVSQYAGIYRLTAN